MRPLLFVLFLAMLSTACNNDKKPAGILDQQKMVSVMADLHTIDGYMSSLMYTDSLRINGKNYYATVYKNHQISKADYEQSLKYYSTQPALIDSMYSQVERILQKKEEKLNKIQEAKQKKLNQAEEAKQKKQTEESK